MRTYFLHRTPIVFLNKMHIARVLTLAIAFVAFCSMTIIAATANAKSAPESFADLAEKLLPSVVNISTTQTVEAGKGPEMPQLPPGSPFEDFFKEFFDKNGQKQRSRRATSLGSGFIISEDDRLRRALREPIVVRHLCSRRQNPLGAPEQRSFWAS